MGDIARLHSAILSYARDFMIDRGFTYFIPPYMISPIAGLGVHPVLTHQLQHRPYGFDRYLSASVHVAALCDLRRDYVCLDRPHDHLWRMVSRPLDSPLGAGGGVALLIRVNLHISHIHTIESPVL